MNLSYWLRISLVDRAGRAVVTSTMKRLARRKFKTILRVPVVPLVSGLTPEEKELAQALEKRYGVRFGSELETLSALKRYVEEERGQ